MTKKIKNIAVITTKQNYKWVSMQEVLPSIEQCWLDAASTLNSAVKIFNADIEPLRNIISFLLNCDAIVIIAFNETIARFMFEIRETLNLQIPFVLHLYGHASIGLWPQFRFRVLQIMNAGDAFIGTCQGDLNCMKLTGTNLLTFNIPYPFYPIETSGEIQELKFAYIGRISDQKNIDILIRAYHLLSCENPNIPHLFIYGMEDNFGSPNMGIPSTNCLHDLKELVLHFKLENKIIFKGFLSREKLYSELGGRHIFLSASTHSDENFGMALFRSLAQGAIAVISEWGGHIMFLEKFTQIFGVPVDFKENIPKPNPTQFAIKMKEALTYSNNYFKEDRKATYIPDYFMPKNVSELFIDVLNKLSFSNEKLNISPTALEMYAQKEKYELSGDKQRVFNSYADPKAQAYLRAYSK